MFWFPCVDPCCAFHLGGATAGQVLELYNGVTRQVARQRGLLLIDLAREMPADSAYYFDLMHYTNAGAARVATIIAARLQPFLARRFPQFLKKSAAFPRPAAPSPAPGS